MKSVTQIEYILSTSRGLSDKEWLLSRHSFAFDSYYNLERLNFGTLRVFNEDLIKPGKGFAVHKHDNMEIITLVLDGSLKHKDNLGNEGVLTPGIVGRMSAGTGIEHSEMNASATEPVHFLQIWIFPEQRDLQPSYEQKSFQKEQLQNQFFPIVSGYRREESIHINQDATIYLGRFDQGSSISHTLQNKKYGAFLFVIEGEVAIGEQIMRAGDAVQVMHSDQIDLMIRQSSQVLLVEVTVNTL